jgi:ankyrin repeat protein
VRFPRSNLDAISIHEEFALSIAIEHDLTEVASSLIQNGCDTNIKIDGMNPVMLALEMDHTELAIELIESGADLCDHPDIAAILLACKIKYYKMFAKIDPWAKKKLYNNFSEVLSSFVARDELFHYEIFEQHFYNRKMSWLCALCFAQYPFK